MHRGGVLGHEKHSIPGRLLARNYEYLIGMFGSSSSSSVDVRGYWNRTTWYDVVQHVR